MSGSEESEALARLHERGLSTTQILQLIQAASDAAANGGMGTQGDIWTNAIPYMLTLAAGVIMYNLTGEDTEDDVMEEERNMNVATANLSESTRGSGITADTNDEHGPARGAQVTNEKNQTNEILKSLADIKGEMTALTSYVRELVAPPIIKDFDIFDKTSANERQISWGIEASKMDLQTRYSMLNQALLTIQNANSKELLVSGCNAGVMYIGKLLSIPLQPRYKRVFKTNSAFQSSFGALEGYEELLLSIGFVLRDNNSSFEWSWSLSVEDALEVTEAPSAAEAKEILQRCIDALQRIGKGEVHVTVDVVAGDAIDDGGGGA